jgi:2-(3-amino-3-carboxypropyl)histidine synthase
LIFFLVSEQNMPAFDFEEGHVKEEIAKLGAHRVLLQLPEGLKPHAPKIAKAIESAGALPIISADPCYGACDIAVSEAEGLGADLIVHFGHTRMVENERVPILYVQARAITDVEPAIFRALPLLHDYEKIGLTTTVQHLQVLNQAKELLTQEGKTVLIGDVGQMILAGQVTGCNYSNAKSIADDVEAFLFVGGGKFHALGIALTTSKPTVTADPYNNEAFAVNDEAHKILKQRFASIQEARNAKAFGVLIGLKLGQKHLPNALKVKAIAQKHNKEVFFLAGREITPEMLLEFPTIDAYVNTACPRISLDASEKFQKPVLTVSEFMVVCGEVLWENLLKKGLFEN